MILQKIKDLSLNWLEQHDRKRIIMDRVDNEPYLERYYVFLKDRKTFPFNVFLHKFLKGDPDDVHDHPWNYFTIILAGGYYEWIAQFNEDGTKSCEVRIWRGPGSFRFGNTHTFHRIELKEGVTPWTLFMPGPQRREWGFLVKNKWIHNDNYLTNRKNGVLHNNTI
jgi:hypothetical protein